MASTGETWRLGRRPALDGLRGVAVVLVVACHAHLLLGGGLGVFVFFALSGFLITSLMLEEHRRSGRVRFAQFYVRRARRLLPALVALVGFVAGFGVVAHLGSWWVTRGEIVGALLYFTNLLRFDGPQGALSHTWSLSMEEQFYLTWPLLLVVLVRFGRRAVLGVSLVLAAASFVLSLALYSPAEQWRVAFGPDTRAYAMLLGCALAAAMHGSRDRAARPRVAAATMLGLLALTLTGGSFETIWAPLLATLGTCVVIATAAARDGVPWLQWRWLSWLGQRSYGIYLWHYPFAVLADQLLPGQAPAARFVLLLTVSVGASAVSWRYVEQPFQKRRKGATVPAAEQQLAQAAAA